VPIQRIATEELQLNTHVIDTFTGWTPPAPIDLIIAVSFGLFVPPRILNAAKYRGLNVHPSLLPDLRGSAPIQHAILRRREYTGVSIQTLHPTTFDNGTILAQTPSPGVPIPRDTTARALEKTLEQLGADMLVHVLKTQSFVPPLTDAGWYGSSDGPVQHAPKISKQDGFVDFSAHSVDLILSKQDALGETWCMLPSGDRLLLHEVTRSHDSERLGQEPGIYTIKGQKYPYFQAACGNTGVIFNSTVAGRKTGSGHADLIHRVPLPQSHVIGSGLTSKT
jgi:methionyl-tRNA formyltransferase